MKSVLIITSARTDQTIDWAERERYIKEFYQGVQDRLEDTQVLYTTYNDITCTVRENKVRLEDIRHKLSLETVDLVHFKNWMFDYEEAAMIAFFLKKRHIPFFNSEVDAGLAWGKISQMCRLAMDDVPVPDTFFSKKAHLITLFQNNTLPEGFTFPLILKADDGSKGNDNHLVKTAEQALLILREASPTKDFVIENYVANDGDYRFLFTGTDDTPLIFHRQGQGDSHLNNTSKGGKGTFIDPRDVPKEYIQYARQAAITLNREISGVDIIVDKHTNKAYVLEVNSTPALATGFGIETKLAHFANFLQRTFEAQEEEE